MGREEQDNRRYSSETRKSTRGNPLYWLELLLVGYLVAWWFDGGGVQRRRGERAKRNPPRTIGRARPTMGCRLGEDEDRAVMRTLLDHLVSQMVLVLLEK